MAVTFAVLGDSESEAQAALERLCDLLSLEPAGPPHLVVGRHRWMGRAYRRTDEAVRPEQFD